MAGLVESLNPSLSPTFAVPPPQPRVLLPPPPGTPMLGQIHYLATSLLGGGRPPTLMPAAVFVAPPEAPAKPVRCNGVNLGTMDHCFEVTGDAYEHWDMTRPVGMIARVRVYNIYIYIYIYIYIFVFVCVCVCVCVFFLLNHSL